MTMVKSRTAPTEEAISFPVLTYSDAAPRSDLCDIDERAKHQENQQSLAQFEFPRPSSGDGRSRRKPPPGTVATFDFRVTAPPDEVVPSHAMLDRSPIGVGIALGSPGMVDSKDNLPPPRFNTSIFTEQQKGQSQQSQPLRKASKWKKIGGLFRAKSALASPTRPRPPPMTLPNHAAAMDKQTSQKAGTEEWPRIESDPKYATTKAASTTPSRSRKFSLSNKKSPKESNGDLGPRLEIDIPDVQMERYSVMFSNVMNKNQRPSLLARRSKTLDSVQVPHNSVSTSHIIGMQCIKRAFANRDIRTSSLPKYHRFLNAEQLHQHVRALHCFPLHNRQRLLKSSGLRTSLVAQALCFDRIHSLQRVHPKHPRWNPLDQSLIILAFHRSNPCPSPMSFNVHIPRAHLRHLLAMTTNHCLLLSPSRRPSLHPKRQQRQ